MKCAVFCGWFVPQPRHPFILESYLKLSMLWSNFNLLCNELKIHVLMTIIMTVINLKPKRGVYKAQAIQIHLHFHSCHALGIGITVNTIVEATSENLFRNY